MSDSVPPSGDRPPLPPPPPPPPPPFAPHLPEPGQENRAHEQRTVPERPAADLIEPRKEAVHQQVEQHEKEAVRAEDKETHFGHFTVGLILCLIFNVFGYCGLCCVNYPGPKRWYAIGGAVGIIFAVIFYVIIGVLVRASS